MPFFVYIIIIVIIKKTLFTEGSIRSARPCLECTQCYVMFDIRSAMPCSECTQ